MIIYVVVGELSSEGPSQVCGCYTNKDRAEFYRQELERLDEYYEVYISPNILIEG